MAVDIVDIARARIRRIMCAGLACGLLALPVAGHTQQRVASSPTVADLSARPVSIELKDAPLSSALQRIARLAGLNPAYNEARLPADLRVTVQLRQVPVGEAFQRVLQGTHLFAQIRPSGDVAIVSAAEVAADSVQGEIAGEVVDRTTKRPVADATVLLDGETKGVRTDANGGFRLRVSIGSHRVTVRAIGYERQTQAVTVNTGQTRVLTLTLEPRTNALDEVVVTGTLVATERRAVPNAMTVISAKEIEQRGITRIDQLFHGDIPGLYALNSGADRTIGEVVMFTRGATVLNQSGAGFMTNPIKTYVDGVEMADPKYLSQIDPKSIERIEILTGPQASTIYGSNAISGVMQIFTKRGSTPRPQFTANLTTGFIQNNYSSSYAPQHNYSVGVSGIEGKMSYSGGGTWQHTAPWTPQQQVTTLSGYAGARLQVGTFSVDGSARVSGTHSLRNGSGSQGFTSLYENGVFAPSRTATLTGSYTDDVNGQSLSVSATYRPLSWWSHEFGVGRDNTDANFVKTRAAYSTPTDTGFSLSLSGSSRTSLRYSTSAQFHLSPLAALSVTLGADNWKSLATGTTGSTPGPITQSSALDGGILTRASSHNTGAFLQSQVDLWDILHLTYGVRGEWNPDFGRDALPNLAPRYGIAITRDIGVVTAKLRGAYGRSTRPPRAGARNSVWAADDPFMRQYVVPDYGNYERIIGNPDLGPEYQKGGEGGLELYLGSRASLVVTRYNQTVDDLIMAVQVDSVKSFVCYPEYYPIYTSDPDGCFYNGQNKNLNVASIRNQGWETQGTMNLGPLAFTGTYTWSKSRVLGITPMYRNQFTFPALQPGTTFSYFPEHTWALGISYARGADVVALNLTGTGQRVRGSDDFVLINNSTVRLPVVVKTRWDVPSGYMPLGEGYAMADLNASHRFMPSVEGTLQVRNVGNVYENDVSSSGAVMGRVTTLGLRLRF